MLANSQTTSSQHSLAVRARAEIELRRRQRARREAELDAQAEVWKLNPKLYAKERLGVELTADQGHVLESIRDNRRTAVKASHAIGKTFNASVAANWWFDCWKSHICYITAPTWGQALGLTFKEVKKMRMTRMLDGEVLDSGLVRDANKIRQTDHFIKALNAEKSEGFQGEHSAPILIILEEAVGVPSYIWDAMEGLMTHPDCRVLAIGNPTDEATKFGEICESANWEVFSVTAMAHPNIEEELHCRPPKFEAAVRLQWLFEMLQKECEQVSGKAEGCFEFYTLEVVQKALSGHPVSGLSEKCYYKPTAFFEGRVLGEFPTEASNKVIPSGWIKSLPSLEIKLEHQVQLGCDVARFGDDRTTIFSRIGSCALRASVMRRFDTIAIADAIESEAKETCRQLNLPAEQAKSFIINIDTTGGLGAGPFDILKSRGYNNARSINSSESAHDDEMYKNKRSELWFDVRDRVREKNLDLSRLDMEIRRTLIKELSTPMYKIVGGKKVVEDKAETKKRLSASPDLADGFNLAFYESDQTSGMLEFDHWV